MWFLYLNIRVNFRLISHFTLNFDTYAVFV